MKIVGNGSLTKLEKGKKNGECRKWRLRVQTSQGEKSRRFTGTWTMAQKKLAEFVAEIEDAPEESLTFKAYAQRWYDYREKSGEFAKRTLQKYQYRFKVLNIHLANTELADITPDMIKTMYTAMRGGETPSGKPISGTYLNSIHILLNQVLTSALDDELISRNPCAKIKAPKIDTREKKALSTDEMAEFLEKIDKRNLRGQTVAIKLAILTGLRRSEISAIRWCDYDGSSLHIVHATEEDGSLKSPKTKRSTRILPLTSDMRKTLDRWHKTQATRLAKMGIPVNDETYIVTEKNGSQIPPHSLGRWWTRNREGFGLPEYTLHELRHSYLTRLVHSGVNIKAALDLAGQKKDDVLMGIYTHTDEEKKREAVQIFEQELSGK